MTFFFFALMYKKWFKNYCFMLKLADYQRKRQNKHFIINVILLY